MKSLTVQVWSDSKLLLAFETKEYSWLETSHIKTTEEAKIYSYDHSRSKGTTISFTHHSEGLVKEFFNLDTLEVSKGELK